MKKLLFLLILIAATTAKAQLAENKAHIWLRYSQGVIDSAQYAGYSLSGEYLITRYIGLNYNFEWIRRTDNIRQFHTTMGLLGGPTLIGLGVIAGLANSSDGDSTNSGIGALGIIGGLIILALPEGASLHIPAGFKWDVSPYANILGADRVYNLNTGVKRFKYACSFGLKTTYMTTRKFTFSAFVETRKTAGIGWSLGGGLGFGYAFLDR